MSGLPSKNQFLAIVCMLLSCHVRVLEWITLYSCLNAEELLAQNRRDIWSDCNEVLTHKYLVRKRTLNHLAKLTKWLVWLNGCVFVCKLSGCGLESRYNHFGNSGQKLPKSRYQSFLVLSSFIDFPTFCKIFCRWLPVKPNLCS